MVAARGAGIRVVMITGDYLLTAIAIAKNVARWQGRGVVKLVTSWLNLIGIPLVDQRLQDPAGLASHLIILKLA